MTKEDDTQLLIQELVERAYDTWIEICLAQKRDIPTTHLSWETFPLADGCLLQDVVETVIEGTLQAVFEGRLDIENCINNR